jgi:hypothetical protein
VRHWNKLPAGVRSDVRDLAQYQNFYQPLDQFAHLCQRNGTSLHRAVSEYNKFENRLLANPVAGTMEVWDRLGLNRQVMVHEISQALYNPAGYAAQIVNNAAYQQGAAAQQNANYVAAANQFLEENPDAKPFIDEMAAILSRSNLPAGMSSHRMLEMAYVQAVKNSRAKAAVAKKASKAVGGSPSPGRGSRSAGGGSSSTRDSIIESINAQRGLV